MLRSPVLHDGKPFVYIQGKTRSFLYHGSTNQWWNCTITCPASARHITTRAGRPIIFKQFLLQPLLPNKQAHRQPHCRLADLYSWKLTGKPASSRKYLDVNSDALACEMVRNQMIPRYCFKSRWHHPEVYTNRILGFFIDTNSGQVQYTQRDGRDITGQSINGFAK